MKYILKSNSTNLPSEKMSEGLDIRLILPFLNDRKTEPVFVNFIDTIEICGAILFIAFVGRILFMVRNMHLEESQSLRDQKLNELMASISRLEKEIKQKKIEEEREGKKQKDGDEEEEDEDDVDSEEEVKDAIDDDVTQHEE